MTPAPPCADYRQGLLARLRDPDYAAGYLDACLKEGELPFLTGLRDVAEAHGGLGALARKTGLNREHLFRLLTERGNPRLLTLGRLTKACGLRMAVRAR